MVTSQHDPWGPKYSSSSDEVLQKFEDDFTTSHGNIIDNSYIALDDSREYLARLEKKLNKLCESSAKNLSSKSLLASLSATRSHHQHNLLSCSASNLGDLSHEEEDLPKAKGILLNNSQTHLSNFMQKMAPEKLALSPEELVQLLAADSLTASQELSNDSSRQGKKDSLEKQLEQKELKNGDITQRHDVSSQSEDKVARSEDLS